MCRSDTCVHYAHLLTVTYIKEYASFISLFSNVCEVASFISLFSSVCEVMFLYFQIKLLINSLNF